jgi:fission process protein 1
MAKDDKLADKFDDIPHERKDPRPDFSTPPPRKRLPQEIMDTLNDEEKLWEVLYEGKYVHHSHPAIFTRHPISQIPYTI